MNAQQSLELSRHTTDTTILGDHHSSTDHIPETADLHGFGGRADRTDGSRESRYPWVANIHGLGGMVDGIVVVLGDRSIRDVATAIRDFADS
ncbi:hypothetical protein E4U45_005504 [Claviceps purpurea]|nr:hypothetical protein E4U45_005504 [Claviceps purpurea]